MFVAYLIGALLLVFWLGIFVTDAMSRALDAQQVFLSAKPTMAAIGFVWPPLPTFLQVPLALLPPLRQLGLSANVLTALTGAGAVVVTGSVLRELGVGRWPRYALLAGLALNPMILFHSINGMSEVTFIFLILLSFLHLVRWWLRGSLSDLMLMGVYAGVGSLARYDTIVHLFLLAPVVYLLSLTMSRQRSHRRARATVLTYGFPAAFIPGLWLWFNFLVMGDPLHFVRGEYSNAAQINYQLIILPQILQVKGNVLGSTGIILRSSWDLFPPFWLALGLAVSYAAWRRNLFAASLALLTVSFPAFQLLNLYAGQSAAFLRYFILAIPYAVLLLGFLASILPSTRRRSQVALTIGLAVLMAVGGYASWNAMKRGTDWGQWNDIFVQSVTDWRPTHTWEVEREIAGYLMKNTSGRSVLVDDFQGYRIVLFSGNPSRFVVNSDSDFKEVLNEPWSRAGYILVPPQRLEGTLNQINLAYPGLYEFGAPWATLEREWDSGGITWRLYRIVPPPGGDPTEAS